MKLALPKLGLVISGITLIAIAALPQGVGASAPGTVPFGVTNPVPRTPVATDAPKPPGDIPYANIIVRKTASAQTMALGATVTFDISITCDGQAACGRVGVGDALPDAFSLVSATATRGLAQVVGNNVTWGVDLMQPKEVIHITIVAKSLKTGCVCNVAQGNAEYPNKGDDDRSQACVCIATPLPVTGTTDFPIASAAQLLAGLGLIAAGLFPRAKKQA